MRMLLRMLLRTPTLYERPVFVVRCRTSHPGKSGSSTGVELTAPSSTGPAARRRDAPDDVDDVPPPPAFGAPAVAAVGCESGTAEERGSRAGDVARGRRVGDSAPGGSAPCCCCCCAPPPAADAESLEPSPETHLPACASHCIGRFDSSCGDCAQNVRARER